MSNAFFKKYFFILLVTMCFLFGGIDGKAHGKSSKEDQAETEELFVATLNLAYYIKTKMEFETCCRKYIVDLKDAERKMFYTNARKDLDRYQDLLNIYFKISFLSDGLDWGLWKKMEDSAAKDAQKTISKKGKFEFCKDFVLYEISGFTDVRNMTNTEDDVEIIKKYGTDCKINMELWE